MVRREALGNSLQAKARHGRLLRSYPLEVQVDELEQAEVEVVGGLGFVPIRFIGLTQPPGHTLWLDNEHADQSVHGNDFWQTDCDPATQRWRITDNVALGIPARRARTLRLSSAFAKAEAGTHRAGGHEARLPIPQPRIQPPGRDS